MMKEMMKICSLVVTTKCVKLKMGSLKINGNHQTMKLSEGCNQRTMTPTKKRESKTKTRTTMRVSSKMMMTRVAITISDLSILRKNE